MSRHKKLFFWCCIFSIALFFLSFQYEIDFSGIMKNDKVVKFLLNFNSIKLKPRRFEGIAEEYNHIIPSNFDCSSFYTTNTSSMKGYTKNRISINEEPHLPMTCADIQRRIFVFREFNESKNTFAVARNVYQDYYLQEILLSYSYSPFNFYCYAVDSKSSTKFVQRIKTLAGCLQNVIVLNQTFSFDSAGHFQNHAHFACMEKLLENPHWKYVLLLQNLDVFIKTPEEISHIIDDLAGAPFVGFEKAFIRRIPKINSWTPHSLKLFKNESGRSREQLYTPLVIRKSSNQAFLSREFVEEVSNSLHLTVLLNVFNDKKKYGVDEMLIPTLISSNFLKLPGQIENRCRVRDHLRYVHWNFGNLQNCKSKKKRHAVCLLGVEYLKTLRNSVQIIANKIWPQFDFGAVICIGEMLHQKSRREEQKVEDHFYRSLPQVRELREKEKGFFNMTLFKC